MGIGRSVFDIQDSQGEDTKRGSGEGNISFEGFWGEYQMSLHYRRISFVAFWVDCDYPDFTSHAVDFVDSMNSLFSWKASQVAKKGLSLPLRKMTAVMPESKDFLCVGMFDIEKNQWGWLLVTLGINTGPPGGWASRAVFNDGTSNPKKFGSYNWEHGWATPRWPGILNSPAIQYADDDRAAVLLIPKFLNADYATQHFMSPECQIRSFGDF